MVKSVDSFADFSTPFDESKLKASIHVAFISRNPLFNVPSFLKDTYQISIHQDYQRLFEINRFRKIDAICLDSDYVEEEAVKFLRHRPYQKALTSIPVMIFSQDPYHNLEFYTQLGAEDYYAGSLDSALFRVRFKNFIKLHCLRFDILEKKTGDGVELAFMAYYDKLTSLPNRQLFQERVEEKIRSSNYLSQSFAVLFLDLDDFKCVNDQNNHQTGDWLLNQVGLRLKNCFKKTDTVARLGGDEFAILVDEVEDKKVLEKIAHRVLYRLSAPYGYARGYLRINVSLGISLFPQDGQDYQSLITQADQAMYKSKRNGKGQFAFASP